MAFDSEIPEVTGIYLNNYASLGQASQIITGLKKDTDGRWHSAPDFLAVYVFADKVVHPMSGVSK